MINNFCQALVLHWTVSLYDVYRLLFSVLFSTAASMKPFYFQLLFTRAKETIVFCCERALFLLRYRYEIPIIDGYLILHKWRVLIQQTRLLKSIYIRAHSISLQVTSFATNTANRTLKFRGEGLLEFCNRFSVVSVSIE